MSARMIHSAGTGNKPQRVLKKQRRVTQETRAQRGVKLQAVRENGPAALFSVLQRLEAEGHLEAEAFTDNEVVVSDISDIDSAPDIDLGDEDDLSEETWADTTDWSDLESLVQGQESNPIGECPFVGDAFALVVTGGTCSFAKPAWVGSFLARTPDGQQVLHEVSARLGLLERVARWLSDNRSVFLLSKDLWDLGPGNMQELQEGKIPVRQNDFLALLGWNPEVSEASFSRFIRATTLVWDDGVAPLNILFSEAARLAWVAKSVWVFAEGRLTESVLNGHADIKVRKGGASRSTLLRTPVNSMDFPTFIEYANLCAGTAWREVLERYQKRMVVPHGGD